MSSDGAERHRGFRGLGRSQVVTADELTPVEAYRETLLSLVGRLDPIELKIPDALGLVLAHDVVSTESLPAFANSSMDGYAVVASDLAEAGQDTPVQLRVLGEVPAGAVELPPIAPGTTVRIMTGAPLPPGADAVVPVEVTTEQQGWVAVHRAARPGEFVRTVGQDVKPGQHLLAAGHRLRPADIGLLSAVGVNRVTCVPTPRVVILSTGDELVPAEQTPPPGTVRNSNGPMLAAMVRQVGALPFTTGIVGDDRKALAHTFDSNLGHADLFVASGGASAGAHDHLHDVIAQLGTVASHRVAMQPGMPQVHGTIGGVPVLGLPGNPVSAFVSFELFVRPVIRTLQGRKDLDRPTVTAELADGIRAPAHKRAFVRVTLARREGRWVATPTGHQGSHVLSSISAADGLAEIPEDVTEAPAGTRVRVRLLVDG